MRTLIPSLLFLFAPLAAEAQAVPVQLDSLHARQSYIHVGEGRLLSTRSCWTLWVGVRIDSASFDATKNVLFLRGAVAQSNPGYDRELGPVKMLVGSFSSDPSSIMAKIDIRDSRTIGEEGAFSERIMLQPGDVLCFTPAETMNMQEGKRIASAFVALYEVGRLVP